MPGGIPVAAFGIGQSGGINSVLFALEILSLNNPEIRKKLSEYREQQKNMVVEKSTRLKDKLESV